MTLVFGGIDLPIFEILFVVSVLLLAGLFVMILGIFYVLNELRELKKIMKKEEDNIKQFEKDMSELKKFKANDKNEDELGKYIKENLEKGFTWAQLKESLVKQGWDDKQLEDAYKNVK
jgi:hypothetical protein